MLIEVWGWNRDKSPGYSRPEAVIEAQLKQALRPTTTNI